MTSTYIIFVAPIAVLVTLPTAIALVIVDTYLEIEMPPGGLEYLHQEEFE